MDSHSTVIRFTTFINDTIECAVFATIEKGVPVIQTVNVVGDCVVTAEDIDKDLLELLLERATQIMVKFQKV